MTEKEQPLFVMAQPETFDWPVRVPVPVDGKYRFAEFTGTFPNLDEEEVQKLLANDAQGRPTRKDIDVAADVLLGFAGLRTPAGGEFPFTAENKAALLNGKRVAGAVLQTFLLAVRGLASEKNS